MRIHGLYVFRELEMDAALYINIGSRIIGVRGRRMEGRRLWPFLYFFRGDCGGGKGAVAFACPCGLGSLSAQSSTARGVGFTARSLCRMATGTRRVRTVVSLFNS